MAIEILKPVLLTGAGFTKDAGGYLAQEMWSQIFNAPEVSSSSKLSQLMKVDFDYESVYDKVNRDEFTKPEQKAFSTSLFSSYHALDERIRSLDGHPGIDLDKLHDFLLQFSGEGNSRGFFFTLNQDLFIERWIAKRQIMLSEGVKIWTPGLSNHLAGKQEEQLQEEDFLTLPRESEMEKHQKRNEDRVSIYGRFQYIKLHGSWNWRTSDGNHAMAIGHSKGSVLQREPLFRWYFDTFRSVLWQGGCRLLVIGYSFGDPHINEIIVEGIEKYGLALFIVSPETPEAFKSMLITKGRNFNDRPHKVGALMIWENGVAGYFQTTMGQLFPKDGFMHLKKSHLLTQVNNSIFTSI
jgi:hypothetical protein